MIRIKEIHIEEFRGIRKLDLNMESKNFGICGPNGTGKSGIVDAIEFCLTGDVTRLSGQGSGDLSVKAHAPHVDQKVNPEKAIVKIKAEIPSNGKTFEIHRSVKNPKTIKLIPNDEQITALIKSLQSHPEFALSRREIIKYILTPPGKRSEDVQTLLRLEHLERLRKSLTTFSNKQRTEADTAERVSVQAKSDLKNGLQIQQIEHSLILEKVNEKRAILRLSSIPKLEKETSFKVGVPAPKQDEKKPAIKKATAISELDSLIFAIKEGESTDLVKYRNLAKGLLEKLNADKKALALAKRYSFIKTGLDLITKDACPLCDIEWKADDLRTHLQKKLLSAQEIKSLVEDLSKNINAYLQLLSERIQAVDRSIQFSKNLTPPIKHGALETYLKTLKEYETTLVNFLKDQNKIESAMQAIITSWWIPSSEQQACIDGCHKAVYALPDSSAEDEARDFLIVCQERYEKLIVASKTASEQKSQSAIAQKVLNYYNQSCIKVLEEIYDKVAHDFSDYYRTINNEDENNFSGKLTSAPAKLGFDVDFYGRGLFPPGAYHSEGHQDGMGLCLYLALMKHTLGNQFTFAVLDDVLMSVDTGHRRDVCRLLKSQFPNTQFILTTHDRVWLQYMKTENLISRSQSFGGWTVDSGPRVWDDHDIWTEITNQLDKEDAPGAAWLLRRYLEYTATILADNLRAPVEFRGDGNYDLGDLLPRVLKQWQKKLEDGEKSATKWDLKEQKSSLVARRTKVKELISKSKAEEWAINPSVHFNDWANLQSHEFQEVVDAFKELLENLRCGNENCKSYLYIRPRKGSPEEIRCNCGQTNINLKLPS